MMIAHDESSLKSSEEEQDENHYQDGTQDPDVYCSLAIGRAAAAHFRSPCPYHRGPCPFPCPYRNRGRSSWLPTGRPSSSPASGLSGRSTPSAWPGWRFDQASPPSTTPPVL